MMANGENAFMKLQKCRQVTFFAGCSLHYSCFVALQTQQPYGMTIANKFALIFSTSCKVNLGHRSLMKMYMTMAYILLTSYSRNQASHLQSIGRQCHIHRGAGLIVHS